MHLPSVSIMEEKRNRPVRIRNLHLDGKEQYGTRLPPSPRTSAYFRALIRVEFWCNLVLYSASERMCLNSSESVLFMLNFFFGSPQSVNKEERWQDVSRVPLHIERNVL